MVRKIYSWIERYTVGQKDIKDRKIYRWLEIYTVEQKDIQIDTHRIDRQIMDVEHIYTYRYRCRILNTSHYITS